MPVEGYIHMSTLPACDGGGGGETRISSEAVKKYFAGETVTGQKRPLLGAAGYSSAQGA